MDESWNHLQNLEAHIKEHNTHIEKITPGKRHSRQSSAVEELLKRSGEGSGTLRMLGMAKELREKDLEIMYLKRDIASLEIFKDQCVNMQNQIKLLREKAVLCEREAQNKTFRLTNLENTTVPRAEKLESELKEVLGVNEKLQQALSAAKKENEDKTAALNAIKNSVSGGEATIKSLEDDKRVLKSKLSELQGKFDEIFKQHEKNIEHLKNKDQLTLALEEDNERLRAQIENTMESLQKCQYELNLLPKLKQDIHQREQLVSAASREIEREKSLRQKVMEEKDRLEMQMANLFEVTDGADPLEYIQDLKTVIDKADKEQGEMSEELAALRKSQKLMERDNSELLQYTSACIENIWKGLSEKFFNADAFEVPSLDESVKPVLEPLYREIQQTKKKMLEKLKEQQDTIQFMSERIAKYEKNSQIRKKMEEMEELIQKQEFLSEQLTIENAKIKKELEIARHGLAETMPRAEELEQELQESIQSNDDLASSYRHIKKELEEKLSMLSSLKQSNQKQEKIIEALEEEKKYLEEERDELSSDKILLESSKKALEDEKKVMLKKFAEVQKEFEVFLNQHERSVNSTKQKEDALAELSEENEKLNEVVDRLTEENERIAEENEMLAKESERMGKELENQIEAIQKCQVEITAIPKLKQEINQKTQQLAALLAEYDKEKANFEEKLENLLKLTENKDPAEYIQSVKKQVFDLTAEKSSMKTEISVANAKLEKITNENSQFLIGLQQALENFSASLSRNFLSNPLSPSHQKQFDLYLLPLITALTYLQSQTKETISELEDNIEDLSEQLSNYEKNLPIKMEQTDDLIQKQEQLFKQLTIENNKLQQDLCMVNDQLEESELKIEDMEHTINSLQLKYDKLKNSYEKAKVDLEEKSKLLQTLNKSQQEYENMLASIRDEKKQWEEEKKMLIEEKKFLEEEKRLLLEGEKDLNTKIIKLQNKFERIFEKQDLNISSIKDRKELVSEMIEDNNKLKKHVENTLQILMKYRV